MIATIQYVLKFLIPLLLNYINKHILCDIAHCVTYSKFGAGKVGTKIIIHKHHSLNCFGASKGIKKKEKERPEIGKVK